MKLATVVRWLVVITIPFFLTVTTVRLLISWDSPSYPAFEYKRIAPDRYGFLPEERLALAEATLDYLRRPEPAEEAIVLLEELRIPGTDQPLYNEREIGHMLDVKKLSDIFTRVMWILGIVVVVGFFFLLLRLETRREGFKAIMQGGIFTAAILLVVGVLIFISWNLVFTQFHELLFPPGTWTFAYTDSLIRLFPERFWFDFGLIWTGLIFIEGLILILAGYFLVRKS